MAAAQFELGAHVLPVRVDRTDRAPEEVGDLLFAVVNVARHLKVDPEDALRRATAKFRVRFEGVEALARERGIDLHTCGLETLDTLWDEVKAGTVP